MCIYPFLHNINTFYSQGGFDFFSIYNYHDNNENKSFNFDDFFLTLVPKIMTILNQEVVRDFFGINAQPNCLAFKLSKEIEITFPEKVQTIFDNSIEMPSYDDKYFRYILSNNMSNFENIKKLQEEIKQKQATLLEETYKIKQKLKEDEEKFPIPELNNPKKNMYDKMFDPYSDPVFDVIRDEEEDEHVSVKINRMANTRIRSNKSKIDALNKKREPLKDIQFYFTQDGNSKETFFFSSGELVLLYDVVTRECSKFCVSLI